MKSTVYLFSSPTCPHCPPAKKVIEEISKERDDFIFKFIMLVTPSAQKMAQKFNVMSVPTFIIQGPGIDYNIGLQGGQSKKELNKYINKSLGNEVQENQEEKKEKGFRIGRFKIKF